MTLTELRDALAKATGPDWPLNSGIARLVLGWKWHNERPRDYKPAGWYTPDDNWHPDTPNWTASIDAAVTLFGPEWLLIILSDIAADGLSLAKFSTTETPVQEAVGIGGRTLALTICLARIEYEIARAALKKLEE